MSREIEKLDEADTYGLAIMGKGIETSGKNQLAVSSVDVVEEFIAGKRNYDIQDPSDNFRLRFTKDLKDK